MKVEVYVYSMHIVRIWKLVIIFNSWIVWMSHRSCHINCTGVCASSSMVAKLGSPRWITWSTFKKAAPGYYLQGSCKLQTGILDFLNFPRWRNWAETVKGHFSGWRTPSPKSDTKQNKTLFYPINTNTRSSFWQKVSPCCSTMSVFRNSLGGRYYNLVLGFKSPSMEQVSRRKSNGASRA